MTGPDFLADGDFERGLSYATFEHILADQTARDPAQVMTDVERDRLSGAAINLQRARRLWRTYTPGPAISALVKGVSAPQRWLVIAEPWCGDCAQSLPLIAKVAAYSPHITLRHLLRDTYPGIMDLYLTDGKRSIPKLIAFGEDGSELFRWGPRPAPAQRIIDEAFADGLPKNERLGRLHLWYGRDRGKTLENELLNLLRQAVLGPNPGEGHSVPPAGGCAGRDER